ncbi:MAG: hypothetical protein GY694_15885 [Gammaproteobacteria bacterium]|nr:hypothetical protein [Gammaproteobacteria bacterium]
MNKTPKFHADVVITTILFVIFVLFVVRSQYLQLNTLEWGDESETIVISKLIASGKKLYSEVFSQHGPLIFFVGIITEQFGDFKHQGYRVAIAIGQLLALFSIYFSPLFRRKTYANIYTAIAATVLVIYMHPLFAHMYMYHTIAGIMLVIILSQYTLPSIVAPERLTPTGIFLGNFLLGALPFAAITYLPASLILVVASLRKEYLKKSLLSISGGFFCNLIFLLLISSVAGYLAVHIYLNFFIYSSLPHTSLSSFSDVYYTVIELAANDFPRYLLFSITFFSILKLSSYEKKLPWRSLLVAIAIGGLMIRGGGFWGLPYYYASLVFPIVFFMESSKLNPRYLLFISLFLVLCILKLSLTLPDDKAIRKRTELPQTSEFSRLVQRLTNDEDRIISYSFKPFEYLVSNRLPASGHIYYLPQQEMYKQNPKFGIEIDACEEINTYQPKIMLIDKWRAWGRFSWDSYGECIQKIIDRNYIQVLKKPYYVRQDILLNHMGPGFDKGSDLPSLKEIMAIDGRLN